MQDTGAAQIRESSQWIIVTPVLAPLQKFGDQCTNLCCFIVAGAASSSEVGTSAAAVLEASNSKTGSRYLQQQPVQVWQSAMTGALQPDIQ